MMDGRAIRERSGATNAIGRIAGILSKGMSKGIERPERA